MSDYFVHKARMENQRVLESEGKVADSMEVRLDLMAQFHRGEKTLEQVQSELSRIKRDAKKSGKLTRSQAYTGRF